MATSTTNMVASQYLDPLTSSPEMLSTPQNTPAWVKAWLQNLHLNSAEKTDEEIGAYLISKHYTSRASLKYGILTDPEELAVELTISIVLASQLCDEANLISQRQAVPLPVFTTPPMTPPVYVSPSTKPPKPWHVFTGKFTAMSHDMRIPKTELDTMMGCILFHANGQSITAGKSLAKFLEDPGAICDEASLNAFESNVDPHDNAQLATLLMNALPSSICHLLRLAHGTTGTGTKIISGFTILQYLFKPHVGVYASKYDHQNDTVKVTNPTVIPQCLYDLHASLLLWRASLSRLQEVNLAPNEMMLLAGLNKLMSKLPPEFTSMLKQAEYMDKVNGKTDWNHTELLKHLDRQAAESLQHPRPAHVTALFAAVDTRADAQVGYLANSGKSTCHGWLLGICKSSPCPRNFAHPPGDEGNRSKLAQIRCPQLKFGPCTRSRCSFKHEETDEPKDHNIPAAEPPATPPSPASSVSSNSTAGTNSTQSTALDQTAYTAMAQDQLQLQLELQAMKAQFALMKAQLGI